MKFKYIFPILSILMSLLTSVGSASTLLSPSNVTDYRTNDGDTSTYPTGATDPETGWFYHDYNVSYANYSNEIIACFYVTTYQGTNKVDFFNYTNSSWERIYTGTVLQGGWHNYTITKNDYFYPFKIRGWQEYTGGGTIKVYVREMQVYNGTIPTVPQISFPSNNSYHYNNYINFTWNTSTGDITDTITYDFWLSNISDFIYTINRTNFTNNWTGNIITEDGTTYYGKVRAYDNFNYSNWSNIVEFREQNNYTLEATSPANGSTGVSPSPVVFIWHEWETDIPYTLYVATDDQFINIVSTSVISSGTYENFTTSLTLSDNTQYWWKAKNNSGYNTSIMNFTTTTTAPTLGRFNITVLDGSNLSKTILNFTLNIYNSTSVITKNSNTTTGWCNLSSAEISSGEYLIVVDPTGTFSNYYQRMVLANSPGNVTMYVPNSSAYTIDSVSFSLLDVTGLFPFQTSTITVSRGGLVRDKSYFGMDGSHIVHLTHGKNYQITIQNGNNVQVFDNYVAYATGTSQITINNFSVNYTSLNPFRYNITHTPTVITLHWSDVGGVMSSLNFTVRNQTSHTQICNIVTSVKNGQTICSINNQSAFFVIFSAKLTDNTYQNTSFLIDYTTGTRKTSTGVNPYDGSPMGTGYVWNYGTWETPDWVYNGICIILFILLAGTFGGYFSGFGGIILGVFALILESVGWFRPLGTSDASQLVVMGITGGLTFLAVIYYLQHKDKGG